MQINLLIGDVLFFAEEYTAILVVLSQEKFNCSPYFNWYGPKYGDTVS